MSSDESVGYLSLIGFNYLEPITLLLDNLFSRDIKEPNEVQANKIDNGLSCSIIVLSVLLLESAIARMKYDKEKPQIKSALQFMKSEFTNYIKLDELIELFVIRDVIVHNHIWEASFRWDDIAGMKLLAAEIWEGSGDNKFEEVIDYKTQKSKTLNLNLFPTRISKSDAVVVLNEVVLILQYIGERGTQFININNQHVLYKGHYIPFTEVVKELC